MEGLRESSFEDFDEDINDMWKYVSVIFRTS